MENTNFRIQTTKIIMIIIIAVCLLIPKLAICLNVIVSKSDFEGSSSQTIVQNAINAVYAAYPTDGPGNVYLPAGTSPWYTTLFEIGGGVSVIGAGSPMTTKDANGKLGPLPTTIMRFNYSGGYSFRANYNYVRYTAGVRISNIYFVNWYGSSILTDGIADFRSSSNFRIDHCHIEGGRSVINGGTTSGTLIDSIGVVDHCNLINAGNPNIGGLHSYMYGVHLGPRTYVEDKPVGMAADIVVNGIHVPDAIVIEDCYLENPYHPISGMGGAHFVFRYSTILERDYITPDGFSVDAHGPGFEFGPTTYLSSPYTAGGLTLNVISIVGFPDVASNSYAFIGSESRRITGKTATTLIIASGFVSSYPKGQSVTTTRGGFVAEVYNNTITGHPSRSPLNWNAIGLRAGKGLIHHNTFVNHRHAAGFNTDQYSCNEGGLDHIWKSYIWSNTYTNVVPDEAGMNWILSGSCNSTYIHAASSCSDMGKEVYGINDGTGGDKGCLMPGYTPYTYPHPLVSGALRGLPNPALNPPKNLSIIKPGDSNVASDLQPSPGSGISVAVDKSSYILGQTALITVTVLDNAGKPVANAHCVITVKRPDGTTGGGMTPYTNKTGIAKTQFRVNQVGSYTVNVVNKGTVVLGKATTTFIGTK